ncbi:MAG: hypothetical protein HYY24_18015 [Verrucomicrobia bacterium]|nr:hypothetical protein [Verrucomicrobiota bacterium]
MNNPSVRDHESGGCQEFHGFKTTTAIEHRAAMCLRSLGVLLLAALALIATVRPASAGQTLYVSKLGDNSDGSSWAKAFRTIQAALSVVPDAQGGHRIVVRPDTYMEANLFPAQRGAAGAYNELIGDFDGRLGSGTSGWVVLDSGDAEKGFKSYDWWGPIRAYKKGWSKEHKEETFSAIGWDRWTLRHLYASGGDGGLFFDLVDNAEPFTVVVEDCVSIGRAFGGGVANILSRPGEPSVFRRCKLWCLDWWGDAAGAYVRAEHPEMPAHPDVLFEDCALVGPDNALQAGNPGFAGFTRVMLRRCQLVSLNFSQPQGKPGTGVIHSTIEGRFLHVDIEDCTLMGCKIFGAGKGEISFTTKGDVKAYVQFQQEVPKGMHRLGHWPVEVFQTILPPAAPPRREALKIERPDSREVCEVAPLVWRNRLALMKCLRPASGGTKADYAITLEDVETGRELARFAEGYSLASALVHRGALYVFASRFAPDSWNDVTLFKSEDLQHWEQKVVVNQEGEHLFNSSVCAAGKGFVMAYESDDPKFKPFTVKFATSPDLEHWTKVPDAVFGADRYVACPCIRYVDGYYYLLYLEHRTPRWFFETYLARSKDLKSWQLSPANPILTSGLDDGINASDPDVIEFHGQTYLYYTVGDQRTWSKLRRAVYPGPLREFFDGYFREGEAPGGGDLFDGAEQACFNAKVHHRLLQTQH